MSIIVKDLAVSAPLFLSYNGQRYSIAEDVQIIVSYEYWPNPEPGEPLYVIHDMHISGYFGTSWRDFAFPAGLDFDATRDYIANNMMEDLIAGAGE